jgi:hypothetical protein
MYKETWSETLVERRVAVVVAVVASFPLKIKTPRVASEALRGIFIGVFGSAYGIRTRDLRLERAMS